MEKALRAMFDFQRFFGEPKLAEIISDVEARCGGALPDDALENVSAAGEPFQPKKTEGGSDD